MSGAKQAPLPGLDEPEETEFILSVTDDGVAMRDYRILIEAMTRTEAEEIFHEEYELYEVGVYDDEWEWEHEDMFARSNGHAKRVALARERDYMEVYEVSPLGNNATVDSTEPIGNLDDTIDVRRAKREAKKVMG